MPLSAPFRTLRASQRALGSAAAKTLIKLEICKNGANRRNPGLPLAPGSMTTARFGRALRWKVPYLRRNAS